MSMKKTLTIAAMAAVMMFGAVAAPMTALAAPSNIDVTIGVHEDQNFNVTVPSTLPLALTADGALTSSKFEVTNNSVFAIHVKNMQVDQQGSFNLVSDANFATSQAENAFSFKLGPTGSEVDAAVQPFVPTAAAFNLAPSTTLSLNAKGRAKNIAVDLSSPQTAAIITWTFAPGTVK